MTLVEYVNLLNQTKRYRGYELSDEEAEIAKDNGFVVVFGYSDDNAEFRGAIFDEIDCYDGGEIFSKDKYYINAVWCKSDISWTYDTNIPHETFDVLDYEDDSIYCRAIVFDIDSLS